MNSSRPQVRDGRRQHPLRLHAELLLPLPPTSSIPLFPFHVSPPRASPSLKHTTTTLASLDHPLVPPALIVTLRTSRVVLSMASSSGSADNGTGVSSSSNDDAPSQTFERDLAQVRRFLSDALPPSTLSRCRLCRLALQALARTHAKRLLVTLLPGTEQICTGRDMGKRQMPIPRLSSSIGIEMAMGNGIPSLPQFLPSHFQNLSLTPLTSLPHATSCSHGLR